MSKSRVVMSLALLLFGTAACGGKPEDPAGARFEEQSARRDLSDSKCGHWAICVKSNALLDGLKPLMMYAKPEHIITPKISGLNPTTGGPGTVVTVSGTGFGLLSLFGPTAVRVGAGGPLVPYTFMSDAQIRFVMPTLPASGSEAIDVVLQSDLSVRASSPVAFAFVAPVQQATVLIVNRSHGGIVSVLMNGVEVLAPQVLPTNMFASLSAGNGGTLGLDIVVDPDANGWVHMNYHAQVSVQPGGTVEVDVEPAPGELLVQGLRSRDFEGADANFNDFIFRIFPDGSWTEFINNQAAANGSLGIVSWPDNSTQVVLTFGGANSNPFTVFDPFNFISWTGPNGLVVPLLAR